MMYISYIIVALIPAVAIVFVVYFFLKKKNEEEIARLRLKTRRERQKYFLEPRLEATQRIILLLERITPTSLVMRLDNTGKSAVLFQTELLNTIRQEFDHNIAQQLFISMPAWDLVKKSKEETIKIINVASQNLEKEATAMDLSKKIFELVGELDEQPTEIAIKAVKAEFQELF